MMADEREDQSNLRNYLETVYLDSKTELFDQANAQAQKLGHSNMSISSTEGRILSFLVRSQGCKKFVEVGTLTGFSALWILSGMNEGLLYTLERDEAHYQAARQVLSQWKGKAQVQQVLGDARENLKALSLHKPFDGIFIDADKNSYCQYLDWADENLRPGGLIIGDNTLLDGLVYDDSAKSSFSPTQKKHMLEFNQRLADPKKYFSMILPTFTGMSVAIKKA